MTNIMNRAKKKCIIFKGDTQFTLRKIDINSVFILDK
jgi:hypothetical protein